MIRDKKVITKAIYQFLKSTREGEDIIDMDYVVDSERAGTEYTYITYDNGTVLRVNVASDSGVAMMKDVLKAVL